MQGEWTNIKEIQVHSKRYNLHRHPRIIPIIPFAGNVFMQRFIKQGRSMEDINQAIICTPANNDPTLVVYLNSGVALELTGTMEYQSGDSDNCSSTCFHICGRSRLSVLC